MNSSGNPKGILRESIGLELSSAGSQAGQEFIFGAKSEQATGVFEINAHVQRSAGTWRQPPSPPISMLWQRSPGESARLGVYFADLCTAPWPHRNIDLGGPGGSWPQR